MNLLTEDDINWITHYSIFIWDNYKSIGPCINIYLMNGVKKLNREETEECNKYVYDSEHFMYGIDEHKNYIYEEGMMFFIPWGGIDDFSFRDDSIIALNIKEYIGHLEFTRDLNNKIKELNIMEIIG